MPGLHGKTRDSTFIFGTGVGQDSGFEKDKIRPGFLVLGFGASECSKPPTPNCAPDPKR